MVDIHDGDCMQLSTLIIVQLCLFLVAALVGIWLQWRTKRAEIADLIEQNRALMGLLEDQQTHNAGRASQEKALLAQLASAEEDVQAQLAAQDNPAQQELEHLQEHFESEKAKLVAYLKEGEFDRTKLQKMVEQLSQKLERASEIIEGQRISQQELKEQSKELQRKLRSLSADLLRLNSLRVSRDRLERDKVRLKERLDQLEKSYQNEKLLTQNLQQELKTSFRASEVMAIRDELKKAEELLQRTLAEKEFIEQHFLELSEHDPEQLQQELERKRREIALLESTVLDMDSNG